MSGSGESEAETRNTSRRYTPGSERRAAGLFRASDDSAGVVAKGLGIDGGTLRSWVRQADGLEGKGPGREQNPFRMQGELRRLKKGNAQPKRDNETLPEASASFAGRNP